MPSMLLPFVSWMETHSTTAASIEKPYKNYGAPGEGRTKTGAVRATANSRFSGLAAQLYKVLHIDVWE